MLRKEYFDMSTYRETLTQYITFKRGGEGSLMTLISQNLCILATVTSCIDSSVRIITKSPRSQGGTSTYILHLSGNGKRKIGEGDGLDWIW